MTTRPGLASLLAGALLVAYPIAAWLGLTFADARVTGLLLLGLGGAALALSLAPRLPDRSRLLPTLGLPLVTAALAGLAALSGDPRAVLAQPVLVSGALLVGFGLSLRTTPFVERLARLEDPALSPAGVAWCRRVTIAWCLFFAANAALSAALALWAPLAWWAAWSGGLAYVAIGLGVLLEVALRGRFVPEQRGRSIKDALRGMTRVRP